MKSLTPGSAPGLALLLVVAIGAALSLGAVSISPKALLETLVGTGSVLHETLILDLRLPRILGAAVVGSLLGLTGVLSQGLFRNPLADPSLIGVTGGALLGGALAIALGFSGGTSGLLLPVSAFAGGLLAVALVYGIAHSVHGTAVATLLLAGVAITALAGALVSLVELAADDGTLRQVALWQLGSLVGISYANVAFLSILLIISIVASQHLVGFLNVLLLGEAEADNLGFTVGRTKLILVVLVAAGVGSTVAIAGPIAFVGLVVPHMVRLYSGPEHARLLPRACLLGAIVLVLADLASRYLLAPSEIPLGVVTALLGVPYFLFLLRRHGRRVVNA